MAKTILDLLQGRIYHNDSQVRTLLVVKKRDYRIPQKFAYVGIKELSTDGDVEAVKYHIGERALNLYKQGEKKSKK